jgi:hypothetical protein
MIVKAKIKNKYFDNNVLSVYKTDIFHYYVRNKKGIIQGFLKENFEILPVQYERELKLNRILNKIDTDTNTEKFQYDFDNASVYVNWSGKYPNLCSGTWKIMINSIELPIPEAKIKEHMFTFKKYNSWVFDKNYSESWETYSNGLLYEKWIKVNDWLEYSIKCVADYYNLKYYKSDKLLRTIYDEINQKDWRGGSCGGCI